MFLTVTTVDEAEPRLLSQEIASERVVSIDDALAVMKQGVSGTIWHTKCRPSPAPMQGSFYLLAFAEAHAIERLSHLAGDPDTQVLTSEGLHLYGIARCTCAVFVDKIAS